MCKSIGKYMSKSLSGKYSEKHLDHTKQSDTDTLKITSKRAFQNTAEITGDFIGNRTADKIENN